MVNISVTPPARKIGLIEVIVSILASFTLLGFGQNVPNQFVPSGVSGGGHLLSIAVNPENKDHQLVVCDMMGVYRTDTKGAFWDLVPTASVSAYQRTQFQFVGSGANQRIYGIRRVTWNSDKAVPTYSADGGTTWTSIAPPLNATAPDACYALFADPSSTSHATQCLVLETWQDIHYSTNGGSTWTQIAHVDGIPNPNNDYRAFRLAGAFWDGNKVYVGTNWGIYTSVDNGSSWTREDTTALGYIIDFCGAKAPTSPFAVTLFATTFAGQVYNNSTARAIEGSGAAVNGLYTRPAGGGAWTNRPGPNGEAFAWVDVPRNDSTLPWTATATNANVPGVFKSTNGGVSWVSTFRMGSPGTNNTSNQNITTGYQGDNGIVSWWWGIPTFGLDVSDNNPDVVVITGLFPYFTENGGTNWKQTYVTAASQNLPGSDIPKPKDYQHTGLGVTAAWGMHWLDADIMFVNSTDVGLQRSKDSGSTWTLDYTPQNGNGLIWPNWYGLTQQPGTRRLYAAVADGNSNDMYEASQLDDAYVHPSSHSGTVLTSTDDGVTWTSLGGSVAGAPNGQFPGPVMAVAVDPANPAHIYASVAVAHSVGLGGIYKSTNTGGSWTKLANPPRTQGRPNQISIVGPGRVVATYCARQENGAFTASSGVFLSTNGGSSWTDVSVPGMHYYTRDICVLPKLSGQTNAERWMVTVESRQTNTDPFNRTYDGLGGVYFTQDSGGSWNKIWTKDSAQSVTYVDGTQPKVYATTGDDGLHVCSDWWNTPATFTKINAFPFARGRRIFTDPYRNDGTLWVTTHGGGIWRGMTSPSMTAEILASGSNLNFRIVTNELTGSAPVLQGNVSLSDPNGWTTLSGIVPSINTLSNGRRYTWPNVNAHSLFTGLNEGYIRVSRTRGDGFSEVSDVGVWRLEAINAAQTETWGVPMPKKSTHRSLASSQGTALILHTPMPFTLSTSASFYVELGNGHRIEVNEGTSTSTTLQLDLSSAFNTISSLPYLDAERVDVRAHWTLGEVFNKAWFHGSNNPSTADRLLLWNGGTWDNYWYAKTATLDRWVSANDATLNDVGSVPVRPGKGTFVNPRVAMNGPLITCGIARDIAFRHPLPLGLELVASGFPGSSTPRSARLLLPDGFQANNNPSLADQLQTWSGDATPGGSAYVSYWFYPNASGLEPYWVLNTDVFFTSLNDQSLLGSFRSYFARGRNTPKPNRVVPCPWRP